MGIRLQDKVALITGGTSGIGYATLECFLAEGARVVFTGRREARGQSLENQLGAQFAERVIFIPANHRLAEDCASSVQATLAAFGRIDILFNNAGIVVGGTAEATTEADWQDTFSLNVTAVWRMSRLVVPIMREQGGGVIINNASDWGMVGAPQAVAYCASKGAVIQMTRAMALDHARENIRVVAICPGDTFVERWLEEGYFRRAGKVSESEARQSEEIPLGRVADVSEIARAVLFLTSEDASFITGTTLLVDGGNTAQ
jgi:NAD(P)-dependent dehydrogenase (short-subunit alcohol dehydrogenase family)